MMQLQVDGTSRGPEAKRHAGNGVPSGPTTRSGTSIRWLTGARPQPVPGWAQRRLAAGRPRRGVIKIERPGTGDLCRQLYISNLALDGDSTLFHSINRNKERYAADLKQPADLAAVKNLVARADVLIQNFRPGVIERLRLDHRSRTPSRSNGLPLRQRTRRASGWKRSRSISTRWWSHFSPTAV